MSNPSSSQCVTTVNQAHNILHFNQVLQEDEGCRYTALSCHTCLSISSLTINLDSAPIFVCAGAFEDLNLCRFHSADRRLPTAWHGCSPAWLLLGFMPPGFSPQHSDERITPLTETYAMANSYGKGRIKKPSSRSEPYLSEPADLSSRAYY